MTEAICATCVGYETITDLLGDCAVPPHHATPSTSTCCYHDTDEERFWERWNDRDEAAWYGPVGIYSE